MAYRKHGKPKSQYRNALLQVTGAAAGRAGEAATLSTDVMSWDDNQECVIAVWPQWKTHKHKLIAIAAGADRHLCTINVLAVAYASGSFKRELEYDPDELNYLFRQTVHLKQPSAAIGQHLKDLVDQSGDVPPLGVGLTLQLCFRRCKP